MNFREMDPERRRALARKGGAASGHRLNAASSVKANTARWLNRRRRIAGFASLVEQRILQRLVTGVGLLLLSVLPGSAQPLPEVVNALSGIQYTPSPQHLTLHPDGTPVVMAYELRFATTQTGCAAVLPHNLGKPTPALNTIIQDPLPVFGTLPANCVYTGSIWVIGQQGVISVTGAMGNVPFVRQTVQVPGPASNLVILP